MFLEDKDWTLDYTTFDPEMEKTSEALCTVGNGYLGTRGAFEESVSSNIHYPGTYIAGVYNRLKSEVAGRVIENEDFVNCPNWTAVNFKIEDGDWFDISKVEVLDFRKQVNFKHGLLIRKIRFKDNQGRITTIESLRFVSMHSAHSAGIRYIVTPENYSGEIYIRSALDGDIINEGVDRYKQLNSLHLEPVEEGYDKKVIYLAVMTNQSCITIVQAAENVFYIKNVKQEYDCIYIKKDRFIAQECTFLLKKGVSLRLDKAVAIYTSRDKDISDALVSAGNEIKSGDSFDKLLGDHCKEWEKIWEKIDIEIEGGEDVQRILRFHSYHLLVVASMHNTGIDASIPARGLHGEAYRGHVFWDELFVLPFFNLHFPQVSRSLLLYRYNRLDKAREYAKEFGYKGAMFPWQSGSDGREETQIIHLTSFR